MLSQDIIDAPAHISFEAIGCSVIPAGVIISVFCMFSKDIHQAPFENFFHQRLFIGVKPYASPESVRIIDIPFFHGHIEISGHEKERGGQVCF